jgi:hypothetical protein
LHNNCGKKYKRGKNMGKINNGSGSGYGSGSGDGSGSGSCS